jgi:O-acetylserine/cysteine efflux transporter
VVLRGERLLAVQWLALALAVAGLGLIAWRTDTDATPWGLAMVLLAAISWAVGNTVSQRAGRVNMLAYVVWGSLFSWPPLTLLAWGVEGPQALIESATAATATAWAAVGWQALGNTLFGYVAWGWLLSRHPASTVTPMALLVPIFGLASSAWWLGESMPDWKLWATALVLAGLALNVFGPRLRTRQRHV